MIRRPKFCTVCGLPLKEKHTPAEEREHFDRHTGKRKVERVSAATYLVCSNDKHQFHNFWGLNPWWGGWHNAGVGDE